MVIFVVFAILIAGSGTGVSELGQCEKDTLPACFIQFDARLVRSRRRVVTMKAGEPRFLTVLLAVSRARKAELWQPV